MTDEQGARRAKYVAKVRKAYRDGELTDAQADALRAAGVNLDRSQPAIPGETDLATTHPGLAAQWHPERNGDLRPTDVTAGSNRKVWWRHWCEKTGSWHEWEAPVGRRTRGSDCPICAKRSILSGFNDFAATHPSLAEQWHPERNGEREPSDVFAGSASKVWWRHWCEETQSWHEWEATIASRAWRGTDCPYCSNQAVLSGFNDLATKRPDLAAQWHPERNGDLRPADVTAGSNRKVWWRHELEDGSWHEWEAIVAKMCDIKGAPCPY